MMQILSLSKLFNYFPLIDQKEKIMENRKQDIVLILPESSENINYSIASNVIRFYMNSFIIEEETETEIVAVHLIEEETVSFQKFEIINHIDNFPWKETILNVHENDLTRSDLKMTCYTDLHFLINGSIFRNEKEYSIFELFTKNTIRRSSWMNSFVTHPHFNLYGSARISIFEAWEVWACPKNDQKQSPGFSDGNHIQNNSIAIHVKKFVSELMLPPFIKNRLSVFLFKDKSPVKMFEDIESFKSHLTNGTLPEEEFISIHYTYLPTESKVNQYTTYLKWLHNYLQPLSKNTVAARLQKYYLQRFSKRIPINKVIAGKGLTIEDGDHIEYMCSRRSFKLK